MRRRRRRSNVVTRFFSSYFLYNNYIHTFFLPPLSVFEYNFITKRGTLKIFFKEIFQVTSYCIYVYVFREEKATIFITKQTFFIFSEMRAIGTKKSSIKFFVLLDSYKTFTQIVYYCANKIQEGTYSA
jgi:hypothetical protein